MGKKFEKLKKKEFDEPHCRKHKRNVVKWNEKNRKKNQNFFFWFFKSKFLSFLVDSRSVTYDEPVNRMNPVAAVAATDEMVTPPSAGKKRGRSEPSGKPCVQKKQKKLAHDIRSLLVDLVPKQAHNTGDHETTGVQAYLEAIRDRVGSETFGAAAEDLKVAVELALTSATPSRQDTRHIGTLGSETSSENDEIFWKEREISYGTLSIICPPE